jgi:hypothetical protein
MPYNLPPDKCLKQGFIFLALVISIPKEMKKQMNIFLRPLMEELKELWQWVDAYDNHLKCRFNLRVAYLWSIHDYLGYDKFVGWCVYCLLPQERVEAVNEHQTSESFKLVPTKRGVCSGHS